MSNQGDHYCCVKDAAMLVLIIAISVILTAIISVTIAYMLLRKHWNHLNSNNSKQQQTGNLHKNVARADCTPTAEEAIQLPPPRRTNSVSYGAQNKPRLPEPNINYPNASKHNSYLSTDPIFESVSICNKCPAEEYFTAQSCNENQKVKFINELV